MGNINWFQSIAFCNELTKKMNGGSDMECVYTFEDHTYGKTDAAAQKIPDMNMNKSGGWNANSDRVTCAFKAATTSHSPFAVIGVRWSHAPSVHT